MDEPMMTSDGGIDAQLVASYLAGDRSALGSIYDRYGQSLFDTATAMTNSRDDASDMVQDVFVLAAERLGQLRDPSRLKPWLFAILRNEVYRRSRRRSRQSLTDFSAPEHDAMLPSTPSSSATVDDAIDGAELAELVRGAASGLDARDQLVLELSVRQGLSGDDLADALGVSAQQSYGLVHRMRERTERSLGAYCVARRGRKDCDELDSILKGWSGDFTVLLRKRVSRHIDACDICERSRRRFAPLALVGAAPAFAAPIGLRSTILERVAAMHPDASSGTGGDGSSSSQSSASLSAPSSSSQGATGTQATFGAADPSTGFPILQATGRLGRRAALWMMGAAAGALIVLGGFILVNGSSTTGEIVSVTSAPSEAADDGQVPPTTPEVTEDSPSPSDSVPAPATSTTIESTTTSTSTTSTTVPATTIPRVVSPIASGPSTSSIPSTTATPTTAPPITAPPTTAPPTTTTTTTTATPTPEVPNTPPEGTLQVLSCSKRSFGSTVLYFGQVRVTSSDADGDQVSKTVTGTLVDANGSKSLNIGVSNDDPDVFNYSSDSSSATEIRIGALLDDGTDQTTLATVRFKPSSSCLSVP